MDAGNILKPALARGELHAIGATTLDEYRKYIEKDQALARRFQTVMVSEPTVEDTISILRGLKDRYEQHHRVRITDSALVSAADLSNRYISDRFLPDKAIDLVDEAASRLRMELDSMPADIDAVDRQLTQMQIEEQALMKEEDEASKERLVTLRKEIATTREKLDGMKASWENEKGAIDRVQDLKSKIEDAKTEMERVTREGNLARASELRFSTIPALQHEYEEAERGADRQAGGRRAAQGGGHERGDRRGCERLDRRARLQDDAGRAGQAQEPRGRAAQARRRPGRGRQRRGGGRAPQPRRPV